MIVFKCIDIYISLFICNTWKVLPYVVATYVQDWESCNMEGGAPESRGGRGLGLIINLDQPMSSELEQPIECRSSLGISLHVHHFRCILMISGNTVSDWVRLLWS